MQLACPSCDGKFMIDPAVLGTAGRKVRCGRCGHSWRALPAPPQEIEAAPDIEWEPPPPAPPEPPPPAPARAAEAFATAPESPPESFFEPAEEPSWAGDAAAEDAAEAADTAALRQTGRRWRMPLDWRGRVPRLPNAKSWRRFALRGWTLYGAVVVVLFAFVVFGRDQIMTWVPETTGLYAVVGLDGVSPSSVLQLRDVRSNWRKTDGARSLVIAGAIVNLTEESQKVPPLIATLVDPNGTELKRWIFSADAGLLPPGGQIDFETVANDPPQEDSLELNLNFATFQP